MSEEQQQAEQKESPEACRNCRFYRMMGNECRAHPPSASAFPVQGGRATITITAAPQPKPDYWCGEWAPMLVI